MTIRLDQALAYRRTGLAGKCFITFHKYEKWNSFQLRQRRLLQHVEEGTEKFSQFEYGGCRRGLCRTVMIASMIFFAVPVQHCHTTGLRYSPRGSPLFPRVVLRIPESRVCHKTRDKHSGSRATHQPRMPEYNSGGGAMRIFDNKL
jgi:hypothetical protein